MSPEQAELIRLDVDTRSDVYSPGRAALRAADRLDPRSTGRRSARPPTTEVRRIIREEEPPRPSTRLSTLGATLAAVSANRGADPPQARPSLRGELDWIVMKALEKDRGRRYETASAFAADVQRYLDDEPVEAGPPSAWYRLRKAARRHRLALTVGATVAIALVSVAALAVARERTERWNSLVQQLQRVRLSAHAAGWSDEAWSLRGGRRRFPATTGGSCKRRPRPRSGGSTPRRQGHAVRGHVSKFDPVAVACTWPARRDSSGSGMPRPTAAMPSARSGTARSPSAPTARLASSGGRLANPIRSASTNSTRSARPAGWGCRRGITPDPLLGRHARRQLCVAACLTSDRGRGVLAVWDAASGRLVRAIETDRADELALAPDGSLVAAVTGEGAVTVWGSPGGWPWRP